MKYPLFVFLFLLMYSKAQGSSCCGGSQSAPALITTDSKSQLSTVSSYSSIIGDSPPDGIPIFRAPNDFDTTSTIQISGAMTFTERWQAGINLPFVARSRSRPDGNASYSGLGDLALTLGYEFLPEYEYSIWK